MSPLAGKKDDVIKFFCFLHNAKEHEQYISLNTKRKTTTTTTKRKKCMGSRDGEVIRALAVWVEFVTPRWLVREL